MSFEDLPADWPMRPLRDPALGADVVDLVVRHADRTAGALAFLLCRPDGTLAQPIVVGELEGEDPCAVIAHMSTVLAQLPDTTGFVLAIARAGGPVCDADRRLHQHALHQCHEQGLLLVGTYLATHTGVTPLPVAEGMAARSGAA